MGTFPTHQNSTIAAIVLAAGLSQRMGQFKPLLPLGACPMIERVVHLFKTGGVDPVVVVAGYRGDEIGLAVASLNVSVVENVNYHQGMFASVLAGIRALPKRCRAFYVHPVDIPLVRTQSVRRMAATLETTPALVLYPTFNGQRGHPVLIRKELAPEILKWSGTGGLRVFLKRQEDRSLEVPVVDEAILLDADTHEDYGRLLARLTQVDLPSEKECRLLMERIQPLPGPIIAHCRAVAGIAQQLAEALDVAGISIDIELVRSAALLHDIARTGRDHAEAGARLLERHGFTRLAPVVAAHMDLEVSADQPIDETQVVYLADKLIAGDQCVDLEQRFAPSLAKYARDRFITARIERRRENARRIQAKVERLTGLALDAIIKSSRMREGASH